MSQEINNKLKKINVHYKNSENILKVYLENYRNTYIYISLDYYKKLKEYRLSWIDLANFHNNFDSVISYEFIPKDAIDYLKNIIGSIPHIKHYNDIQEENKVTITSNLKIMDGSLFSLSFNHYIDKDDTQLFDALACIFNNLPKKLEVFFTEMASSILGITDNYAYRETLCFDLFNDDLKDIFEESIIDRGEKYYNENRVFFLEKIKDTYYSVVGGKSLYVITIKYDEEDKQMNVYCSCPCNFCCKHIYAVIMAIRNNKYHKFYKISYNQGNLLDKILNFNFILSIGIDDQGNNFLIIEDDVIKLLPIKDKQGICVWHVLEDDSKNTMSERLEKIL